MRYARGPAGGSGFGCAWADFAATLDNLRASLYIVRMDTHTTYLSTAEAAELLGITRQTLAYHVRRGSLVPDASVPRGASGTQHLFLPATIEAFALIERRPGNPDIANLAKTRKKKSLREDEKNA